MPVLRRPVELAANSGHRVSDHALYRPLLAVAFSFRCRVDRVYLAGFNNRAELKATMAIQNRLTELLGIMHPVLLAPMDLVSGARLAAAVSQAGGLGLLGGGYGDGNWIEREWSKAGNARIGCGFITGVSPSNLEY